MLHLILSDSLSTQLEKVVSILGAQMANKKYVFIHHIYRFKCMLYPSLPSEFLLQILDLPHTQYD